MLIISWGEVFRISKKNWIIYLQDYVSSEGEVDIRDYGKSVGVSQHDITDLTPTEASELLVGTIPSHLIPRRESE